MDYIITVISPCYNSERTLKRCIESISNQSIGFENIELILYDDASTDNTRKIIVLYSEKYDNIVPIFSNSNQGPGVGKDSAIEKATGKYIMFIDSDDEYDRDMCESLLNEINDDIDIVSCNYETIDGFYSKTVYCKFKEDYKSKSKSSLSHDELIYLPSAMVVNKMFKRNLILKNNVKFTSLRNGEDELFLRQYLLYSKNLIHLNNYVGYRIYKQDDSISKSQTVEDLFSYLSVCRRIKEIYEHVDVDMSRLLEGRILLFIQSLFIYDILDNYDKKQLYDALDNLSNLEKEISFNRKFGLINDISNFFIKHKQFWLVVFYSKALYTIRNSRLLLKLYRRMT
ncbi:MAG: glycosyltransferase family 2 protein [Methanobrevibacter sp.]|nr:glycosyltransferase family 2 protein [Methanobrevibacter sp.]